MDIVRLRDDRDIDAMISAQFRTFTRKTRRIKMSLAEKARAKAAAIRAGKPANGKPAAKPAAKKNGTSKSVQKKSAATKKGDHKPRKQRESRATEADLAKVAKLHKAGKTSAEISDAMGWTQKGNWPYQYTLGVLRRLRKAGTIHLRKS
jgi:hypothetical protein